METVMTNLKELEQLGRKTWLAGLGAIDTTKTFATKKVDDALTNTNELVNELISKGEKLENELQDKMNKNIMLDERVAALKAKLGLSEQSTDDKVDALNEKVDALTKAVEALIASDEVAEKPAPKARKTATKAAAKK